MAGARVDLNSKEAHKELAGLLGSLENPAPVLQQIREYLTRTHKQRFREQRSPDGIPWQALAPSYQKRKHKNSNKVLTFRGHLSGTLAGVIDNHGLEFGTNRTYGAIHHFGGEIKHPGGQRDLFFKERGGAVGNRFVKRKSSNFAQTVNVGPYTIKIPARPWLGTSDKDDEHILGITRRWLQKLTSA